MTTKGQGESLKVLFTTISFIDIEISNYIVAKISGSNLAQLKGILTLSEVVAIGLASGECVIASSAEQDITAKSANDNVVGCDS